MRTGKASAGVPLWPAFLRFFLALSAALLLFTAAAGASSVPTWEERLQAAREKYNADTVNVYQRWQGKDRRGKINVVYYRKPNTPYYNFRIKESLQITDDAEMEAILEVIAASGFYDAEEFGPVSFMKAEWIAHNIAHEMATGTPDQQKLIKTVVGNSIPKIVYSLKQLDLSPYEGLSDKEKKLYELIEAVYNLTGHP